MSFFSFQFSCYFAPFPKKEMRKILTILGLGNVPSILNYLWTSYEFWLALNWLKKNYAKIKICPEGHLQSRAWIQTKVK